MKKSLFIVLFFSIVVFSCKNDGGSLKVDLSEIDDVDIKINRYDKELYEIDLNNLHKELEVLNQQYYLFIQGKYNDTLSLMKIREHLSDSIMQNIYKDCIGTYPDLNSLETGLAMALRYFKYYYPESNNIKVYSYASGVQFEYPVIFEDTILMIGIDNYLGSDYEYYTKFGIPAYRTARMSGDNILADCIKEIANRKIPFNMSGKTLLDNMIHQGKIYYFIDAMLPDVPDSLKIGYSNEKLVWCKNFEVNIWAHIIENDLLFTKDYSKINKLFTDGPFTGSISKESPARLGSWVGWQIVRAYMNKNSDISLKELISETNSQKIIKVSKYKPER